MANVKGSFEAENFRQVWKRSGLSGVEFAESLGIDQYQVARFASGARRVSRDVLERLAEVYHVDVHGFLFGGSASDTVHVEFLDAEAAAGRGIEAADYPECRLYAVSRSFLGGRPPERVKAVRVRGDSMIDEKICDGDVVFFDVGETSGEHIFVLSVGSDLLVKRVVRDVGKKSVTLLSANAAYPPRVFSGPDADSVRIVGRVVGWMHRQ